MALWYFNKHRKSLLDRNLLSYWEIYYNMITEYIFWPKINVSSSYFSIFMLNCLEKDLNTQVWNPWISCVRAVKPFDLINQNTLTWPNSTLLILVWNTVKWLAVLKKNMRFHSFGPWIENLPTRIWIASISYVSFIVLWHNCQMVSHPTVLQPLPRARDAGRFYCLGDCRIGHLSDIQYIIGLLWRFPNLYMVA